MIPLPTVARLIVGLPASLLERGMKPRPATEGAYPLGSPNDRLPAASRGAYSPIVNIWGIVFDLSLADIS